MEFGIFANFQVRDGQDEHEAFKQWLDLAMMADDMGIDVFWLGEFHFRPYTPLSAPVVVGSAIAMKTKRLKIGLGVQLLPILNPITVAEQCATLDHLSEGRFVFGVGRSSFIDSYNGYGIDYEESRPRFFEALEVIRAAWRDEPFSHEGEFYSFHDVNVVPKPFQKPHPPIRIACESQATFSMMGELGFPILIRYQVDTPEIQRRIKAYETAKNSIGFGGPNELTMQTSCYLAETAERAMAEPKDSTMRDRQASRVRRAGFEGDDEVQDRAARHRANLSYEEIVSTQGLLFGTPEQIIDRMEEFKANFGITGVSLAVNPGGHIPYDRVVNSIRLLSEKVIPHFN